MPLANTRRSPSLRGQMKTNSTSKTNAKLPAILNCNNDPNSPLCVIVLLE
jgi:hypothetical protein